VRTSRWTIIAGVLVAVAAIVVVIALLSNDSSGSSTPTDPSIAQHQNYHQEQYDAGIINAWPQEKNDQPVGDSLKSTWRYKTEKFTIVSTPADEASPPAAAANAARLEKQDLPSYRERGLKEIRLRGIPAVRWSYDLSGNTYVEYYFEECGISFVARGSAPPSLWGEISSFFHQMAGFITAKCD
jgi:hypothetical protein